MSRPPQRQLVSPLPASPPPHGSDVSYSYSHSQTSPNRSNFLPPSQGRTQPTYGIRQTGQQAPSTRPYPATSGASSPADAEAQSQAENVAKTHWRAFREFLSSGMDAAHPRQNKAREKLTRLSRTQFQELSTDVYDEVQRRGNSNSRQVSLPANPGFHPKRNQAREKLASLQTTRFKDLASDVFYEIERRFPVVNRTSGLSRQMSATSDHSKLSAASSKPAQSSNMFRQTAVLPNKSVMVEDGDSDYDDQLKSPGYDVDSFSMVSEQSRSRAPSAAHPMSFSKSNGSERGGPNGEQERLINDLRSRIRDMELSAKNDTTQRDLTRALEAEKEKVKKFEEQLQAASSSRELKSENERLQQSLRDQEQVTEEVRAEAEGFLNEMRLLSEKESTASQQLETLQQRTIELETEVQLWKKKYQDIKIQLRQVKTTSQFFAPAPTFKDGENNAYIHEDGIIRETVMSKFQLAIDELLRSARTDYANLLLPVKEVVLATRSVHNDLEKSNSPLIQDQRVMKLRQRMTNTTNNLMTACKNHISGGALSPVSLVDAAASHLTTTVIELAKICKLKANETKIEDDFDFGIKHESSGSSEQSDERFPFTPLESTQPRIETKKNNSNHEVRQLLESQTGAIVSSIQKLLSAIRIDAKPAVLQTYMNDIVGIVSRVTLSMRQAFTNSMTLRAQANHIVAALESCTVRMREMEKSTMRGSSDQATKEFKQELAGIAFDTAKQTKELSIVLQDNDEEEVDLT